MIFDISLKKSLTPPFASKSHASGPNRGGQSVYKYSSKVTIQDYSEAKKILNKVRGACFNENDDNFQLKTKMSNPKFSNDDKNALMPLNHELNFLERKKLLGSIDDDLQKLITELMLKADRKLVEWQTNR